VAGASGVRLLSSITLVQAILKLELNGRTMPYGYWLLGNSALSETPFQIILSFCNSWTTKPTTPLITFVTDFGFTESVVPVHTSSPSGFEVE